MTAPELSAEELATVARFDAAQDAPESLRERVAAAIQLVATAWGAPIGAWVARDLADAAIAVVRGA